MEDSVTYQAIIRKGEIRGKAEGLAEGKVEEARRMLLRIGRRKLGSADARVHAVIDAMTDVERLEELAERVQDVFSWGELLAIP